MLDCEIVQLAHHGQDGWKRDIYEAVHPDICLWCTPSWLWINDSGNGYNTHTWKTFETRAWVEEMGVKENYITKDGDHHIEL